MMLFQNFFINFKQHINQNLKKVFFAIFVLLMFLCSGNGLISLYLPSFVKIGIYVALFLIITLIYILKLKPKKIKLYFDIRKLKIPPLYFIISLVFIFILIVSLITNSNISSNIFSYLDIIFIIYFSVIFITLFSFKEFILYFNKILLIIICISIFLYLLANVGGYGFSTSSFISGTHRYDNYLFLNLFYNEKLYGYGGDPRFFSIFWEPGVCGTFLSFGILNEICFKKTNCFSIILFCFGILLTSSLLTYVLLYVLLIVFVSKKMVGTKRNTMLIVLYLIGILFLFVLFFGKPIFDTFLPGLFDKFYNATFSFTSRIFSPYFYFQVFTSSPHAIFLGIGGVSANEMYYAISSASGYIDSGTSTSAYLLAAYGISGALFTIMPILGILKMGKEKTATKIALIVFFIIVFNKENHGGVLISFIYLFYAIRCIPLFKTRNIEYFVLDTNLNTTVSDLIFKNENNRFSLNIIFTFIVRFLAIFVSICVIPVYSSYFSDSHSLDVWLVIYSFLSWILLFDFGFGNGMKNRLIESLAIGDKRKSREHITNTYFPTIFIALVIFIILTILCFTLDVNVIFGDAQREINAGVFKLALFIIIISICLNFVLRNISFVFQAIKKNALAQSFSLISTVLLLFLLILFKNLPGEKFLIISLCYLFAVNAPLLIATLWFFIKNPHLLPNKHFFSFKKCIDVMGMGIKYFVIQLCTLVLWSTNAIMITHFFDPASELRFVYFYTCYYKIFSTIVNLVTIIATIVWIEAREALIIHNISKIKKLFKLSLIYGVVLILGSVLAGVILQSLFNIWLGTSPENYIHVDFLTLTSFLLYAILTILAETLIIFANAFARLKVQIIISVIFALLKIPFIFILTSLFSGYISWQILVLYNAVYALLLVIFIGIDLFSFIKKQTKIHNCDNNHQIKQNSKTVIERVNEYYEANI